MLKNIGKNKKYMINIPHNWSESYHHAKYYQFQSNRQLQNWNGSS